MDFYTSNGVLYHHGIKGQQWGVKNGPPYPLSDEEKKKVSKQYKKTNDKALEDLSKQSSNMISIADKNATEATHEYLNKLVAQGLNPDDVTVEDYQKVYSQYYSHLISVLQDEFYSTNANVKEGRELVKKYDMTSWDELAKINEGEINRLKKVVGSSK